MHTHSVQSASITNQIHSRTIHARVATLRVATQHNTPPAVCSHQHRLAPRAFSRGPARTTLARTHARARAPRKRTRTRTRMLRRAPRCNLLPAPLPGCLHVHSNSESNGHHGSLPCHATEGLLTFANTPPRPCLEVEIRSTRCLRLASDAELSQFAMARLTTDTTRKLGLAHNCHWKLPV